MESPLNQAGVPMGLEGLHGGGQLPMLIQRPGARRLAPLFAPAALCPALKRNFMNTDNDTLFAKPLLSTRLKALWNEEGRALDNDACYARQQEWIAEYAALWAEALRLPDEKNLKISLCRELGHLENCPDIAEVERRCRKAMLQMKKDWEQTVSDGDADSVVEYYDSSVHYAYELMWWHTLEEDQSPLAYVGALHLAVQSGCSSALDFGAGVGAGALLFSRHGLKVALADISSTLLDFARRRLVARRVDATFIDLKTDPLPADAYDFITAMDVFEHIAEPEKTVDVLAAALRPGGILFGRFSAEPDDDRPSHIAKDFSATFQRLADLGFEPFWQDDWLWGHQAFRKKA